MSLTARQTKLYVHTIDIYHPENPTTGKFGPNDIRSFHYPSSPTVGNALAYKETAPGFSKGDFYGRRDREDTESLMDRLHVDYTFDLRPGTVIQFTLQGHPDYLSWYLVTGDNMVKNFKANKLVVYLKKITKPVLG